MHKYGFYGLINQQMRSDRTMIKVKQTLIHGPDGQQQLLVDSFRLLDNLWEMRLVQKISRPVGKAAKQKLCHEFESQNEQLCKNLHLFRVNIIQKSLGDETLNRAKSMQEEVTSRNNELKRKIKQIQIKLNEVFNEGSFKHFRKIKQMFDLETVIEVIHIEDWASDCLEKLSGGSGDCC